MRKSFGFLLVFPWVFFLWMSLGNVSIHAMDTVYLEYGLTSQESLHESFKKHIKPLDAVQSVGYLEFPSQHRIDQASLLYVKKALRFFKKQKVGFVLLKLSCESGDFESVLEIANLFQKLDVNDSIPVMAFIDSKALGFSSLIPFACRYIFTTGASKLGDLNESDLMYVSERGGAVNECLQMASLFSRPSQIIQALLDQDFFLVRRGKDLVLLEDEGEIISTGDHPDIIYKGAKGSWTITAEALIELGLADVQIRQAGSLGSPAVEVLLKENYLSQYEHLPITTYQVSKGYFFMWITNPVLNAVILIMACLGLFYQFLVPTWSWISILTGIFLGVLLYAGYILDALHWVEILVFSMGFVLFTLEKTFIRGFSTLGILGCFLIIISSISVLLPGISQFSLFDFESFSIQGHALINRMILLASGVILSLILAVFIRKHLIRKGICIREADVKTQPGDFLSRYQEERLPPIGSLGTTDSLLRPFGKVKIHGKIFDAIAIDLETIDKQEKVVIIKHKNGKLIVKSANVADSFET